MTHVGPLTGLPAELGLDAAIGQFLVAAAFVLGAFMLGVLAELALTRALAGFASRTPGRLDDLLADAFRGPIRLFFTVIGVLLALLVVDLPALVHRLASLLLDVAVMLVLVIVAARLVGGLIFVYGERSRLVGATRRFLRRVAVSAIYVIGFLFILDNVGISITPLLTTLGLAGLAAALAFQDTLANFFAGVYVQADKPLDVGHRVRFEDLKVEGTVVDVGWRTTKLRTAEGDILVIPNTKVAAGVVIDYDLPEPRTTLRLPVRVARSADPRAVASLLEEVARGVGDPGVIGEPRALFSPGFVAGAFEFTLVLDAVDIAAKERVAEELRFRVVERLRGAGVEMT
jgi:small-conductance mechanosensitive channel